MRVIRCNESSQVVEVKNVLESYIFGDGEIQSDTGELGQIMQPDGTFIWPEPEIIEPMPTPEEIIAQTFLNTEYLVILSEISNL